MTLQQSVQTWQTRGRGARGVCITFFQKILLLSFLIMIISNMNLARTCSKNESQHLRLFTPGNCQRWGPWILLLNFSAPPPSTCKGSGCYSVIILKDLHLLQLISTYSNLFDRESVEIDHCCSNRVYTPIWNMATNLNNYCSWLTSLSYMWKCFYVSLWTQG
jgi:hypothetical protein